MDVATAESRAAFAENESIAGTTVASEGVAAQDDTLSTEPDGGTEPDVASPEDLQDRDPGSRYIHQSSGLLI